MWPLLILGAVGYYLWREHEKKAGRDPSKEFHQANLPPNQPSVPQYEPPAVAATQASSAPSSQDDGSSMASIPSSGASGAASAPASTSSPIANPTILGKVASLVSPPAPAPTPSPLVDVPIVIQPQAPAPLNLMTLKKASATTGLQQTSIPLKK